MRDRVSVRRRLAGGLAALSLLVGATGLDGARAVPAGAQEQVAGPVIVDVAEGVTPQAVAARYGIVPTQTYTDVMVGFAATVTVGQLASLRADRSVESVTVDAVTRRRGRHDGRTSPGPPPAGVAEQFEQYVAPEIRRIGAPMSPTADIDGKDDRRVDAGIAIVDSGIDPYHPDLNVVGGYDCLPGPKADRGYFDRGDSHGTAVAGLAAAIDNGIGTVGAAPGARLYAVRVADPFGSISDSALLCGLDWVIRHADLIDVANLSLAGTGNPIGPCRDPHRLPRDRHGKRAPVDRVHQRICRATAKGITVVAAAGNDSRDASLYTPAAYDEVIAVSAFTDFDGLPGSLYSPAPPECLPYEVDDTLSTFSNFGRVVDISAPGECTFTTGIGGVYGYVEGTSFAAPLVSGAAALIKAKHPNYSAARVRERLLALAQPGPLAGDPDQFPEGLLNVAGL